MEDKCLFVFFLHTAAAACSCNPNFVPTNSGKLITRKKYFHISGWNLSHLKYLPLHSVCSSLLNVIIIHKLFPPLPSSHLPCIFCFAFAFFLFVCLISWWAAIFLKLNSVVKRKWGILENSILRDPDTRISCLSCGFFTIALISLHTQVNRILQETILNSACCLFGTAIYCIFTGPLKEIDVTWSSSYCISNSQKRKILFNVSLEIHSSI